MKISVRILAPLTAAVAFVVVALLPGSPALQSASADSTNFSIPQYNPDGMGIDQRVIVRRSGYAYQARVWCRADEIRTGCSAYDNSRTGENNEADAKPIGVRGCQGGEEIQPIYAYCLKTN